MIRPLATGVLRSEAMSKAWPSLLLLLVSAGVSSSALFATEREAWKLQRAVRAPIIDGDLSDEIWQSTPVLTNFLQAEPEPEKPPTELTELRVVYDATHVYFSLVAHDRTPAGVVATQRKRDADLADDDHATLVFDPFLDQRNGYLFSFNSLGARRDGLIEGGELLNANWDGIWDVAARRTSTGWQAEGTIPLSTFSFDPSAPAWGFNVERVIARRNERIRWSGLSRQYQVNTLAEAGHLVGLAGIERGRGIEWRPYASLTYVHDKIAGIETTRLKPGFDLFYKISNATTAVLTVNTDFADADVDERQVNLTRFPISFPEKRAFFLQDAGIFSFSLINSSPLPYNSRRIGIGPRGEVIDIEAGFRVTGREGRINFGLLGVRTDESGELKGKELSVGRVLVNIFEESAIGLIATSGDPASNGHAWLAGADFNFRTTRLFGAAGAPFEGSIWVQHTGASDRPGDGGAYGYELEYDSRTWGFYSFYEEMGPDYYPALGFVKQAGIWQGSAKLDYEFRPERLKRIVPLFQAMMRHNNLYDAREYEMFGPEVSFEGKRGDVLLLRARRERERLPVAFRVANGVVIRPGSFDGEHLEGSLTFAKSRPLAGTLGVARRLYYGGTQTLYKGAVTWRPSPVFNLDAGLDYTDVTLPYAYFPVRLLKIGGAVQFSPDLVWSMLAQHDNLSHSVGFNTRVRWTYSPGGDVFFVVNQGIDTRDDRWDYTRTELSSKLGATWRF